VEKYQREKLVSADVKTGEQVAGFVSTAIEGNYQQVAVMSRCVCVPYKMERKINSFCEATL
jgi:hypothetical protein